MRIIIIVDEHGFIMQFYSPIVFVNPWYPEFNRFRGYILLHGRTIFIRYYIFV